MLQPNRVTRQLSTDPTTDSITGNSSSFHVANEVLVIYFLFTALIFGSVIRFLNRRFGV